MPLTASAPPDLESAAKPEIQSTPETKAASTKIVQTESSTDHDNQKHLHVGGYDFYIDDKKVPFLGVAVSSIILIIALYGGGKVGRPIISYGITVGSVALVLALWGFSNNKKYLMQRDTFLFIWCFIGACFMTFKSGPFFETGNGYFASWALAVSSVMTPGLLDHKIAEEVQVIVTDKNLLVSLGASAVVVFIASIPYIRGYDYHSEAVIALVIAILTIAIVVYFLYPKNKKFDKIKPFEFFVLLIFSGLWIFAASLVTFRGPFTTTGNGYFASWAGAISCCKVTSASRDVREK